MKPVAIIRAAEGDLMKTCAVTEMPCRHGCLDRCAHAPPVRAIDTFRLDVAEIAEVPGASFVVPATQPRAIKHTVTGLDGTAQTFVHHDDLTGACVVLDLNDTSIDGDPMGVSFTVPQATALAYLLLDRAEAAGRMVGNAAAPECV